MSESRKCPDCGAELGSDAPAGLCVPCALKKVLQSDSSTSPDNALQSTIHLSLPPTEKSGDKIGNYKLHEQIGEGGCGVVYSAEQKEPIRRKVALKVIKLGMDTKQVVARFEAERQALAMMDHPNIAKVLDAGATETGRPYFVMELVRGIKITDYCDKHQLSTEERLKLFVQVCHAIQHAHQKGIIHRDIKPSNILVTLHDGVPVPKVIDFGIAKATTGQPLSDKTIFTAFEQFIGTPAYMSPEQAEMSGLDIDTRTDVYALGVLLYELLTGKTPFDAKALFAKGLDEIRRVIREEEPPRPSTRLSTLDAGEQTALSKLRQSEPPKLLGVIRGDLDWIVMKTLEKDRTRRYETANGLAMDIERYVNAEPVSARPPSQLYRFQKMVKRNKMAVATAVVIAGTLIIGSLFSTWRFVKEKAARERAVAAEKAQTQLRHTADENERKARAEATKSQEVSQFLKDMLKSAGPSVALGRDTTLLREILDHTADRIRTELKGQPDVQAELMLTLTEVYNDFQFFAKAEESANIALEIAGYQQHSESRIIADTLCQLSRSLHAVRKLDEGEAVALKAIVMQRRLRGPGSAQEAIALTSLADCLRNQSNRLDLGSRSPRLDRAEAAYREALAIKTKQFGRNSDQVALGLSSLSIVLQTKGMLLEAEQAIRESLTIQKTLHGENHILSYGPLAQLGSVLKAQGQLDEAEACIRQAILLQIKGGDTEGWFHALQLIHLGQIHNGKGELAEAETCLRRSVEILRKQMNQDMELPDALIQLSSILRKRGQIAEANSLSDETAALYRKLAQTGRGDAQHKLGSCYENGTGVTRDMIQAIEWYSQAADQGRLSAQVRLGSIFMNGIGVEQNVKEGIKWLRMAAEQGDIPSMNKLGWILATIGDVRFRDGDLAQKFSESVLKATGRSNHIYLCTMAAALAELGQYSKAVEVQKEAIALVSDSSQRRDYDLRVNHFASGKSYISFETSSKVFSEKFVHTGGYFGNFSGGDAGHWKEGKNYSPDAYYFEEIARTNGVIVLEDASRNYLAKFQKNGGIFWLSYNRGKTWQYFYDLTRRELDGDQFQPTKVK
jgi:serine/threonine protein kinase